MKYSIIIPLFNKQKYILDTLQSVLAQTFNDFEVIVIDDGSTDNSITIVESIHDSRIKLIKQKNAGVAVARNSGISHANGEWIGFLDADDWQHPDYLSRVSQMIETFPASAVVATRFAPIPDCDAWKPEPWSISAATYETIQNLPRRWMQGVPFFTGSIVIKRDVFQNVSPWFEPGESIGEDLDLWFRIAEKHEVTLMEQPLIAYRTAVANSLSAAIKDETLPPYVTRMASRAKSLPKHLAKSTSDYVTFYFVTMARKAAIRGKKYQSLALLTKVISTGIVNKRWWMTFIMSLFLPSSWINKWETWRKTRKYASIERSSQL